jgi:hypothetical protein
MKDLISELQAMLLKQQHRIASLENRLERQNEIVFESLSQQEQQFGSEIESLKSEIVGLEEANELRQSEQTEIALRVGLLEEHQEERKKMSVEVRFVSEAEKIVELKADLISQSVLPEQFFNCTGSPFEGTMAHLTRESGGNIADGGIVEITASSVLNDRYNAKYVADLTDIDHEFASENETNQWIEWNFKAAEIEPAHYSIRTDIGSGGGHLQHWVLEGRIGDEKWRVLGERYSDSQLKGSSRIPIVDISTRSHVRMIRLR